MEISHKIAADGSLVGRLYEQHGPALFAYLNQQTNSHEAAEDVLVEVFVAALEMERFGQMSEKEQVSWLWRVTRNKAVDAYRRSQVRRGLDLSLVAGYIDDKERSPQKLLKTYKGGSAFAWSPDGKYLATYTSPLTSPFSQTKTSKVTILDADTGAQVGLYTSQSQIISSASWSPDSRSIATHESSQIVVWAA